MRSCIFKYLRVRILASVLFLSIVLANGAYAALTVTNFTVTSSFVSFDVNGTIDGPGLPNDNRRFLFISTGFDGTDFLTGATLAASAEGFIGYGALESDRFFIENGDTSLGDRISIGFNRSLNVGDVIDGSIKLNALGSTVIDPIAFRDNGFAIHWGRASADRTSSPYTGIFQGAGDVIPEPSASLLLGIGVIAIAFRRYRKR